MRKPAGRSRSFGRPLGSANERLTTVGTDWSRRKALVVRARSRRRVVVTALRRMIARAAVAPPPPMQGKAVGRAVVTILAVRTALAVGTVRAVAALRLLGLRLRLAAGDE